MKNVLALLALPRRYFVDDLPGARIPATRLRDILESISAGRAVSPRGLDYLQAQGLLALRRLAIGEISAEGFKEAAQAEQASRLEAAEVERLAAKAQLEAEEATYRAAQVARALVRDRERERAEELRRLQEQDPKFIARRKNQELRASYMLDHFLDEPDFSRVIRILRQIDAGFRLDEIEVLWLKSDGQVYFTPAVQSAFHGIEAVFFAGEYRRTGDAWNAVNASGHFRKCGSADRADALLASVPEQSKVTPKLRSALLTTHGGALRDLGRLDEALVKGTNAHALTPRDFRPCTLLGAVNIELGNLTIGWDWYQKAEQRGASEQSVDQDLRVVLRRASQTRRQEIRKFLLNQDPERYRWVDQELKRLISTD